MISSHMAFVISIWQIIFVVVEFMSSKGNHQFLKCLPAICKEMIKGQKKIKILAS